MTDVINRGQDSITYQRDEKKILYAWVFHCTIYNITYEAIEFMIGSGLSKYMSLFNSGFL